MDGVGSAWEVQRHVFKIWSYLILESIEYLLDNCILF